MFLVKESSVRKWITFGDLHINKPLTGFVPNPYNSYDLSPEDYYHEALQMYILDICAMYRASRSVCVAFLGDITHTNSTDFKDYEVFYGIVDTILTLYPDWEIRIVLGNHDSSGALDLSRAKLNDIRCYDHRIHVHAQPEIVQCKDVTFCLLPYMKKERILDILLHMKGHCQQYTYILSHNNIYIADTFYRTPMVNFSDIKKLLSPRRVVLINGHLHRFYYEPDYCQLGSVNPTSFKEYPSASGVVVVDRCKKIHKAYKNTKLFFVSILDEIYLDKVTEFALEAQKRDSIIFLRVIRETRNIKNLLKQFGNVIVAYTTENI